MKLIGMCGQKEFKNEGFNTLRYHPRTKITVLIKMVEEEFVFKDSFLCYSSYIQLQVRGHINQI